MVQGAMLQGALVHVAALEVVLFTHSLKNQFRCLSQVQVSLCGLY